MDYTLPDDRVLSVPADIRMRIPEPLFKPHLVDKECSNIQELCESSIKSCDVDIHRELAKNIVLSGGSTLYEGMADRLKKEVENLFPAGWEVGVATPPECKHAAYRGALIIQGLSTFESKWISKEEYNDNGPRIVHAKCP
jgi:actin, other eukaryote